MFRGSRISLAVSDYYTYRHNPGQREKMVFSTLGLRYYIENDSYVKEAIDNEKTCNHERKWKRYEGWTQCHNCCKILEINNSLVQSFASINHFKGVQDNFKKKKIESKKAIEEKSYWGKVIERQDKELAIRTKKYLEKKEAPIKTTPLFSHILDEGLKQTMIQSHTWVNCNDAIKKKGVL